MDLSSSEFGHIQLLQIGISVNRPILNTTSHNTIIRNLSVVNEEYMYATASFW